VPGVLGPALEGVIVDDVGAEVVDELEDVPVSLVVVAGREVVVEEVVVDDVVGVAVVVVRAGGRPVVGVGVRT